jgi:hypothetical protein
MMTSTTWTRKMGSTTCLGMTRHPAVNMNDMLRPEAALHKHHPALEFVCRLRFGTNSVLTRPARRSCMCLSSIFLLVLKHAIVEASPIETSSCPT